MGRKKKSASAAPAAERTAVPATGRGPSQLQLLAGGIAALLVGALAYIFWPMSPDALSQSVESSTAGSPADAPGRSYLFESEEFRKGPLQFWWGNMPGGLQVTATNLPAAANSNVRREDYIGPESCRKCHESNYEGWSRHPHRWMNALADDQTVVGDFSGDATIEYLGGTGRFYRQAGEYRMRVERGSTRRIYRITQTLGSRFFQYYIGVMLEGPEPLYHKFYHEEHVLPFGYWIEPKQWVPTVHVGPEVPDGQRPDPYDPPTELPFYALYATNCSQCHSTYPVGDLLVRKAELACRHLPYPLHMRLDEYLAETHPEKWSGERPASTLPEAQLMDLLSNFGDLKDVRDHAVTFGISCEACHYGSRQHAEGKLERPSFFPVSPHLAVEHESPLDTSRNATNVNWVCGRCHTGERPYYANGCATWNSTEAADAMRGACYSQLTCIQCHDPHQPIGMKWTRSGADDDASCLSCHRQFEDPPARVAHTHHPMNSEGSRCMNCHMPRINEGMQDMVRTHMIFSPTQTDMLEQNHPNACNMCHADWPIAKTAKHLQDWYGASYSQTRLQTSYPHPEQATVLNWLQSNNEAVRLVAADVIMRQKADWALPDLLTALDDPYLINRQFAAQGIQKWFDVRLSDFGYQFYQSPDERRLPIEKIRAALLSAQPQ